MESAFKMSLPILLPCIKREEQAHADAADLAIILGAAKTEPITPDQARKGVDDATRTRIADMLNRPL